MITQAPRPRFILYAEKDGKRQAFHSGSAYGATRLAEALRKAGYAIGDTVTIEQHELALSVQVLRPKPGELIVMRHRPGDCEAARGLSEAAKRIAAETGLSVLVVPDATEAELRGDIEEAMRRAGWVRARTPLEEAFHLGVPLSANDVAAFAPGFPPPVSDDEAADEPTIVRD
jgi:hypothetical protein